MAGKPRKRPTYIDGVLAAQVALAEIVGPMKMADMDQPTWDLICKLNVRFCEMALDEIKRLDGAQ